MTLAPRACAVLMIAAPEPGSRSTSRMTFAPLVSAWSAWLRWVAGSPCALTIVCGMPAALNAWSRYLRSCVSQRTDDCVSGSSTATLALPPPPPPPLVLELLLLDPQPAAMAAARMTTAPSAHLNLTGTASSWLTLLPSLSDGLPSAPRQGAVGLADDEYERTQQLGSRPEGAGDDARGLRRRRDG